MNTKDRTGTGRLLREVNGEGSVLLRNNGMLPLGDGDRISVFGRMQNDYYMSGTGSGGRVNAEYITHIFESLIGQNDIDIDMELSEQYRQRLRRCRHRRRWIEPYSRRELRIREKDVKAAAERSDKAVAVIARVAGEDRDLQAKKGCWYLSDTEYDMLAKLKRHFKNVCVVLNVGSIMDMSWVEELNIDAVLCVWYGGQEGGAAAADILCGKMYPSGKLSDTIAVRIDEYPAFSNFGGRRENVYSEDIFVGYRYFESFCPDKVLYPFGFGLGYTDFDTRILSCKESGGEINVLARVTNTGTRCGKETVQVYFGIRAENVSAPCRALAGFCKTRELAPGESAELELSFAITDMAVYDDTGVTGHKSCYVLDRGCYDIYAGTDSHSAGLVYTYVNKDITVVKHTSAHLPPDRLFSRLACCSGMRYRESVPAGRRKVPGKCGDISITGNKGYSLDDVRCGRITIEEFTAQFTVYELACLMQGEGMNSRRVRPGTAGAIGGVTDGLCEYGIPAVCVADGPSGLRLDNGDRALSGPCATLLACTWNGELVRRVYEAIGRNAAENDVDALLGPGINIHRFPMCGRNFEYMSEDPYLTGKIGTAVCEGLMSAGVTGVIKHFAANNQEYSRFDENSVVSERALREIYLKPFEMIIKSGTVYMIMTAYNKLNGVYCCADHALNTDLLRGEWGYDGMVMSDWWTKTGGKGGRFNAERTAPVRAQNDVYMVTGNVKGRAAELVNALGRKEVSLGEMQRNVINILKAVMRTKAFKKIQGRA